MKSPLRYPGGKARAIKMFLEYVPPHTEFIEAFAGGASMFFAKPMSDRSWLNDNHPGLYAFFIAVRDHYDEFVEICLNTHEDHLEGRFDYWKNRIDLMNSRSDMDIVERGSQFYFLNRTVWGGRVIYDPSRRSRLYFSNPDGWNNIEKKMNDLREVSDRLQWVKITCLGFEKCICGSENTFLYLDPPYYRDSICSDSDRLYDNEFPVEYHAKLKEIVSRSRGKVMLSYDDCEEVRKLYEGWNMCELGWTYCGRFAKTMEERKNKVKEKKTVGRELLIMNYEV